MKKVYNQDIEINTTLCREDAERLLKLLPKDTDDFKWLIADLESELAPHYEYRVRCVDCNKSFKLVSAIEPSAEELKQKGVCADCSDDYK